jgi:hypothetical protein
VYWGILSGDTPVTKWGRQYCREAIYNGSLSHLMGNSGARSPLELEWSLCVPATVNHWLWVTPRSHVTLDEVAPSILKDFPSEGKKCESSIATELSSWKGNECPEKETHETTDYPLHYLIAKIKRSFCRPWTMRHYQVSVTIKLYLAFLHIYFTIGNY